ncbi:thioredoxin-like isoform X1 [Sebastes fasciatus]|uniref:thioredoxin-like isoform X1 n=1 Tax=Sebastes fasciatus TaxID=394691 RepID=UPI003D9E3D7B
MREVTTLEEFEAILKEEAGDKLVAVDFKAKCCCHCQMIGPKFEEMEKTFADEKKEVIFLKVDVTEGAKIIEEYPVKAIPTFMFFKDAKKVDELVSSNEKKLLKKLIALSSSSPTDQCTHTQTH